MTFIPLLASSNFIPKCYTGLMQKPWKAQETINLEGKEKKKHSRNEKEKPKPKPTPNEKKVSGEGCPVPRLNSHKAAGLSLSWRPSWRLLEEILIFQNLLHIRCLVPPRRTVWASAQVWPLTRASPTWQSTRRSRVKRLPFCTEFPGGLERVC